MGKLYTNFQNIMSHQPDIHLRLELHDINLGLNQIPDLYQLATTEH